MQKYVVRISGYPSGATNREDFIAATEIEAAARAVRRFDDTPGGVPDRGKLEVRLLPGGIARPFEVAEARKWLERNGDCLGEDESQAAADQIGTAPISPPAAGPPRRVAGVGSRCRMPHLIE